MVNQNGLDQIVLFELVLKILPGLEMLSMPTIFIHGQNAPIKVFVTEEPVSVIVSLVMMVLLVKELPAQITVTIEDPAGQKSYWLPKLIALINYLGMP